MALFIRMDPIPRPGLEPSSTFLIGMLQSLGAVDGILFRVLVSTKDYELSFVVFPPLRRCNAPLPSIGLRWPRHLTRVSMLDLRG